MAVSAINGTDLVSSLVRNSSEKKVEESGTAFETLLNSAIDMYKEADSLQSAAEESEINFALGYTENTHDVAIAQYKANIALQYTVKVTNKALEAYKELMNMQI